MKKTAIWIIPTLAILCFIQACTNNEYVPKQKGFNRIDLPKHEFTQLNENHPYTFEYSKHAIVLKDTNGLVEPHWIHVYYPQFKATIDITYKDLGGNSKNDFKKLINDANKLTAKHQIKASSIEEVIITRKKDGRKAFMYELQGEVPSPFQFHITDSTNHFLNAALYFETATQNDSLAPVINYLKTDLLQMINTVEWKK
jgi:gliding motility-associated lipoprotein GldD